ncbi:hypothetical protein ALC53_12282 [Atta colombica]|uniref:Uncharacterized protein n=1 Tax=Atta colombica TaxID=520822 RepID=A0A195AYM8_9HYME|nr:hypothetical protein ALC53_12282 [Atta colombica]
MEHRPVRETLVQATTTAAAAIHRCGAPCKKLFHTTCICNKSPIANDGVTLPENSVIPEELVLPSSSSYVQLNEDRLSLTDDSLIEDSLIDYVENVEDVMSELFERIFILPFLLKNNKIFIKIAMIF